MRLFNFLLLASFVSLSSAHGADMYKVVTGEIDSGELVWTANTVNDFDRDAINAEILGIVTTDGIRACFRDTKDLSKCEVMKSTFINSCYAPYVDTITGKAKYECWGSVQVRYKKSDITKKITLVTGEVYSDELVWYNATREQAVESLKAITASRAMNACVRKADAKTETCQVVAETFKYTCQPLQYDYQNGKTYQSCYGKVYATFEK